MWLQSNADDTADGSGYQWGLWKPGDRDRIVNAWEEKLRVEHADTTTGQEESRTYFRENVGKMAENLSLTLVTDAAQDPALVVPMDGKMFVYFGAMAASCVHLACWLVLDPGELKKPPGVCCCFLNSSFTQKSDVLTSTHIHDPNMFDLAPVLTGIGF
jgi:hypothetical protein